MVKQEQTNYSSVVRLLEHLRHDRPTDALDETLGRLALTLAQALDDGAGMATAAVSKELRATLTALTADDDERSDDDEAIFGDDLPASIRNAKKS